MSRRVWLVILLAVLVSLLVAAPTAVRGIACRRWLGPTLPNRHDALLVVAGNAQTTVLYPCGRSGYSSRLTEIEMQESVAPESQELLLSGDSGTVHLISGHDGGGWVYGARVVRSFGWATSWAIRSAFSRCAPCYQDQGR